ncbi:hypothetical protein IAG41_19985 [Sphingomonas sp. JC676]|uniref:hypothetical protein n=1 Tax=Sphingomonas sp. JC676 TaxID=2768065 RepID=UPI0016577C1D|nr:hypothetical protein [Sphingomonas sp. JC676]MBC9034675.1 hypothetical protein [Sphingomonas sp. JC676]
MRNYLLAGGVVGCLPFLAAAFSVATSNKVPVKARIASIDRTCEYTAVVRHSYGETLKADCNLTKTFEGMRDHAKDRTRDLKGKAKVTLSYMAPGERYERTGTIELTGRDDEFYTYHYGDVIQVKIDKADPSKVSRY